MMLAGSGGNVEHGDVRIQLGCGTVGQKLNAHLAFSAAAMHLM